MWRDYRPNLGRWLLEVILYGIFIFNLFFIGGWPIICGYWIRYVIAIAFFIAALKSFKNVKRNFVFKRLSLKHASLCVLGISLGALFAWELLSSINGTYRPPHSVSLSFPLKEGEFYILHGGSNETINHHCVVSAQKYALDILQLNRYGLRSNNLIPKKLNDFKIYGTNIYSPCDGLVIEASDHHPDLELGSEDPDHPAGNYLAIAKKESDIIVILAHLMPNSLTVKKGDIVQEGQLLGKVGNTGNTSEPHLHLHAVLNNTGDPLFTGQGVPMTFNNRFLVRNDLVSD